MAAAALSRRRGAGGLGVCGGAAVAWGGGEAGAVALGGTWVERGGAGAR